jgi:hypothetical protein
VIALLGGQRRWDTSTPRRYVAAVLFALLLARSAAPALISAPHASSPASTGPRPEP